MKPSLHIKVWILLGYVVLCTLLVLFDQQADTAPPDQAQDRSMTDGGGQVETR